ncbi:MAG: diketogulonate reductase-like aldo/keto reductase, partial [Bradymonadia bacterium]
AHIEEIRAAGLPLPAANQLELHPWSQKTNLVAYLRENGILPIAYSSLRQSEVSGRSVAVRVDRRAEARLRPQRASASDQKGPC